MLHVNVGGLDFFGHKGPFGIRPDGFTGWDEGVALRSTSVARAQGDGVYEMPVFKEQRFITLAGNIIGKNVADLGVLRERFTGLLSDGKPGRIVVRREWGDRWAECYLEGQPKTVERGGTRTATFELDLRCPDPYRYADTRLYPGNTGQAIPVFHWGNVPAWPRVVVTGSLPGGYRISAGGDSVSVTTPVTSGNPHTVWFRQRRLRIDGATVFGGVADSQFFRIPPGPRTNLTVSPLGGGSATVTVYVDDTFI